MIKAKILITLLLLGLTSLAQNKVAVLEDFRGHKCGLCPAGDLVANQISQDYGDSVIVIAVHAGSLASPNGSGTHTTDFRSTEGNTYNSDFGIVGNPTGVVNRVEHNGNLRLNKDNWEDAVQNVVNQQSPFELNMINGYDSTTKEVTLRVKTKVNQALNEKLNLTISVLEDSVYDWQTDYNASPNNVEFYLFNHILRGNLNGVYGTEILDSVNIVGDSATNDFAYVLDSTWNENNLSLVAYVHNSSTREIYQAHKINLDLNNPPIEVNIDTTTEPAPNSVLIDEADIQIFPNPTRDKLVIKSTYDIGTVELVSLQGKIQRLNIRNNYVDLSSFNSGIYFLRMQTPEGVITKRVEVRK